jgi:DsbC/DsbD-like thiol-disulfide interchange protein
MLWISTFAMTYAFTLPLSIAQALDQQTYPVQVKIDSKTQDSAGRPQIDITVSIKPGWSIFANPIGAKDTEGLMTKLTIGEATENKGIKISYPMGQVKQADHIGQYFVYENTIVLNVTLEGQQPMTDLEFKLFVQPFSVERGLCIAPKTFALRLP